MVREQKSKLDTANGIKADGRRSRNWNAAKLDWRLNSIEWLGRRRRRRRRVCEWNGEESASWKTKKPSRYIRVSLVKSLFKERKRRLLELFEWDSDERKRRQTTDKIWSEPRQKEEGEAERTNEEEWRASKSSVRVKNNLKRRQRANKFGNKDKVQTGSESRWRNPKPNKRRRAWKHDRAKKGEWDWTRVRRKRYEPQIKKQQINKWK
jgi:hypothetical protein